jgi:hypothetical protein
MYDGNAAHSVVIQDYDYRNVVLVNQASIPTWNGSYWDFSWWFTNWSYFYMNKVNTATVRYLHVSPGTAGHILRIDYCALVYLEDE